MVPFKRAQPAAHVSFVVNAPPPRSKEEMWGNNSRS